MHVVELLTRRFRESSELLFPIDAFLAERGGKGLETLRDPLRIRRIVHGASECPLVPGVHREHGSILRQCLRCNRCGPCGYRRGLGGRRGFPILRYREVLAVSRLSRHALEFQEAVPLILHGRIEWILGVFRRRPVGFELFLLFWRINRIEVLSVRLGPNAQNNVTPSVIVVPHLIRGYPQRQGRVLPRVAVHVIRVSGGP
mmetsp:Transcript_7595/g.14831  ORF Transcript_7595/g.14831 Transcript_7595/m.14831 type:complete len:201 (+) Transcript_7595:1704-2306(+)